MRVRIAASAPPMVIAGSTRCASEPEPDTGSQPNSMAKNRMRIGPSAKLGNDNPSSETKLSRRSSQRLRRSAERTPAGIDSASATQQRGEGQLQRGGIGLRDHVSDILVEAQRLAHVAVHDAAPVVHVLLSQGNIEPVSMARRGDVGGGRAFAQHLLDGIARAPGESAGRPPTRPATRPAACSSNRERR